MPSARCARRSEERGRWGWRWSWQAPNGDRRDRAARRRWWSRRLSPKRLLSPEPFARPSSRRRKVLLRGPASPPTRATPGGSGTRGPRRPTHDSGARAIPEGRRTEMCPRPAATISPEMARRQERTNVRLRWNRTGAGILTGPSGGAPPRRCEEPQKVIRNNALDVRHRRASWVTLRTSREATPRLPHFWASLQWLRN